RWNSRVPSAVSIDFVARAFAATGATFAPSARTCACPMPTNPTPAATAADFKRLRLSIGLYLGSDFVHAQHALVDYSRGNVRPLSCGIPAGVLLHEELPDQRMVPLRGSAEKDSFLYVQSVRSPGGRLECRRRLR